MNPKLMALQEAISSVGGGMGGEAPPGAPMDAPPEMAGAPAMGSGDVTSAASQAMELLAPFADQPGIAEVLSLLEGTVGGPEAGVAEDPMMEEAGEELPV